MDYLPAFWTTRWCCKYPRGSWQKNCSLSQTNCSLDSQQNGVRTIGSVFPIHSLPAVHTSHQSGILVTINELALIHYYHSKCVADISGHRWSHVLHGYACLFRGMMTLVSCAAWVYTHIQWHDDQRCHVLKRFVYMSSSTMTIHVMCYMGFTHFQWHNDHSCHVTWCPLMSCVAYVCMHDQLWPQQYHHREASQLPSVLALTPTPTDMWF